MKTSNLIGIISDTHGLLRETAREALAGCNCIIHAGDIGKAEVLTELRRIAPVWSVRGNVDQGAWADQLPQSLSLTWEGVKIFVIHQRLALNFDPGKEGFHLVVSGHSHQPSAKQADGVIYLNPGSAGPKRFNLPVRLARIGKKAGSLSVEWVNLLS